MSDFLTFILIDLISTGLFYMIGSLLIPALTLGRVVAGGWTDDENSSTVSKSPNARNIKVLGAWYVMGIGGFFWAVIAVVIWKL